MSSRSKVFIFNGPVPPDSSSPSTISVPAPRKAFAHLVLDPLAATTTVPDPLRPNALLVEAPFEDAPLDVVSEAELSDFVGKVRFSFSGTPFSFPACLHFLHHPTVSAVFCAIAWLTTSPLVFR